MNEHADVMSQVRESFSGLRMDTAVENVFARSRARRRRRLAGITAAAVAAVGAAAAIALPLAGVAPAQPGNRSRPSPSAATLAAFSVTNGPAGNTTLILHKGGHYAALDPSALRQALAEHGIAAVVTVGTFCRPANRVEASFSNFVHLANLPDGSSEMVINGAAMPPGTELSIGYMPNYIRMAAVGDRAALTCSSNSGQPAAHPAPSGTTSAG